MNDLISRSALIEQIQLQANRTSLGETCPPNITGKAVVGLILQAPAVDAVPVVRCGECIKPIEDCPFKDNMMLKTDFCSYGERRNGDG